MARETAREAMLAAIRAARPPAAPRPMVRDVVRRVVHRRDDCVHRFIDAAREAGAEIVDGGRRMVTGADPNTFVCEAVLGVAENGAVWLPGSRVSDRAALFLATHVVVVLDRSAIVDDLHSAYARINVASDAFGVFMAGPSKTADIEQSLVIGAHGPRSLTIVLVEEV
jgi:hypothetical protein